MIIKRTNPGRSRKWTLVDWAKAIEGSGPPPPKPDSRLAPPRNDDRFVLDVGKMYHRLYRATDNPVFAVRTLILSLKHNRLPPAWARPPALELPDEVTSGRDPLMPRRLRTMSVQADLDEQSVRVLLDPPPKEAHNSSYYQKLQRARGLGFARK